MICAHCGEEHDEVVLHSKCHPMAPTWVWLTDHGDTALATVRCAECDKEICTFDVNGMRW
jgi:hypothetical protein